MEKKLKYRNIAISGKICAGATTLATLLQQKLDSDWQSWSGGQIVRDFVKKNSLSLENSSQRPADFDRQIDEEIKRKLRDEDHLIIESWLSGFDAQGIAGVLKVLLVCSNEALRIDRLVNREGLTVEQAKEHLKTREQENILHWQKLYGPYDFWDPQNFDLVIDTYSHSKEETLREVLGKLGF